MGCLCESIASILLCGLRYFRSEERKESVLVIPVGSVTAQTELTYEYGVRRNGNKPPEKTEEKGTWEECITSAEDISSKRQLRRILLYRRGECALVT